MWGGLMSILRRKAFAHLVKGTGAISHGNFGKSASRKGLWLKRKCNAGDMLKKGKDVLWLGNVALGLGKEALQ